MSYNFYADIDKFNSMYSLPMPSTPTTAFEPVAARQAGFKEVLTDEVNEVDEIIAEAGKDELDDLVALADWLGDIVVYATSEARRYGIPLEAVLEIIMQSNFSKLGADGKPIIANHKVQKGPGYWKPEPKIKELLQRLM